MTEANVKMDAPFADSLLDRVPAPKIGTRVPRIDGPRKVTGTARYAAEHFPEGMLHGVLLRAPLGFGRITKVNTAEALAMPGVLAVIRDERLIRNGGSFAGAAAPAQGVKDVAYFGQPIGLVVADSLERARAAALSVSFAFDTAPGVFDMIAARDTAQPPTDDIFGLFQIHTEQGDIASAASEAAAVVDAVWQTPSQSHAAMEPHASIAVWQGERLTVYGSYQSPVVTRDQLATVMGLEPTQVRILSPYVGGGFGGKLGVMPDAVAAAIAAQQLGRPVKVVMTRQQVFEVTGRRPMTYQSMRLGADARGRLTLVQHETITDQLPGEIFFEPAGLATHLLYAAANRMIDHKVVRTNKLLGVSMRAPGEAVGQLALECAMDELADALKLDPIELRLRNEPERHPETGLPFSSRALVACLKKGAERFGWSARNRDPGRLRDGEWLVGQGVSAAARGNLFGPSRARVRIEGDGRVTVETEMTDIGTGTYTILAQIVADLLGVELAAIDVKLGDTDDPASAGSGGSWGATTSGSAVYAACTELRTRLAAAAGALADTITLAGGVLTAPGIRRPITELVGNGLAVEGLAEPGDNNTRFNQTCYGAHFCEVKVHVVTGEVRVARWNSVFAAGRILNLQTATSQAVGGIVLGIGSALTEELIHDPRSGKVVNHDFGEYHVAVHADIPSIDVHFLEERDYLANPLLAKGVGELGVCGAGAAVANAVYNATSIRVREFPITLDKLLTGLPSIEGTTRRT